MRADEPSLTALGVALARSVLERPSTPTGDPAADDALAASLLGGAPAGNHAGFDGQGADPVVSDFVRAVSVRTEFFDRAVLDAEAEDIGQVVILGAGYDGRALRFRAPDVRFFEVDHPATQGDKRRRLEQLGIAAGDITFVAADFTEPGLEQALAAAGQRQDARTLFVLEGVLRYLPEEWFRELLAATARRGGAGSELAVSISTREEDEPPEVSAARREHERGLAAAGEAVLTVPARDVALAWVAAAGWTVTSVVDIADVHPGTRPGRLLVRCRRDV